MFDPPAAAHAKSQRRSEYVLILPKTFFQPTRTCELSEERLCQFSQEICVLKLTNSVVENVVKHPS